MNRLKTTLKLVVGPLLAIAALLALTIRFPPSYEDEWEEDEYVDRAYEGDYGGSYGVEDSYAHHSASLPEHVPTTEERFARAYEAETQWREHLRAQSGYSSRPGILPSEFLEDYAIVAAARPETMVDFNRALDLLDDDGRRDLAMFIVREEIAGSHTAFLESEYARLTASVAKSGFNPARRYREENRTRWEANDPFRCNFLDQEIDALRLVAGALGRREEEIMWTRHFADYHTLSHSCDGGSSIHYERAAELYRSIGDEADAVAMERAEHHSIAKWHLEVFIDGQRCYQCGEDLEDIVEEPFRLDHLEEAASEFALAGITDTAMVFSGAGALAAEASRFEAARRAYELAGESENASRMAMLAGN